MLLIHAGRNARENVENVNVHVNETLSNTVYF